MLSAQGTRTARPQRTILYGLSALCIFDCQLAASQKGPDCFKQIDFLLS